MTDRDQNDGHPAARANSFPWPPVLLVAAVAGSWALSRLTPLRWPGTDDTASHVIGYAFGIIGLSLAVWAILTLRRAGTTVMPDGVSTALVTSGPYTRLRNPIYVGDTLLLLFAAEITKNLWFAVAALVFVVAVTALQIIPEERHLSAKFGDAYEAYRARTRRWI
jgi:protein-S-isoprenylcysteine O-methyltransferase Ste14